MGVEQAVPALHPWLVLLNTDTSREYHDENAIIQKNLTRPERSTKFIPSQSIRYEKPIHLAIASIILAISCFQPHTALAQSSPNIVLIFCDDLGYADVVTPHIDALARRGTIFKQAYVAHPFCGLSRMALLSGRMPPTFGGQKNLPDVAKLLEDYNQKGIPEGETLISTVLKQAGYATGCMGKWHVE
ncbi:MAG: hypothetical protein ACI9QL_001448 [Candidatus Omnitrophota bacterium]